MSRSPFLSDAQPSTKRKVAASADSSAPLLPDGFRTISFLRDTTLPKRRPVLCLHFSAHLGAVFTSPPNGPVGAPLALPAIFVPRSCLCSAYSLCGTKRVAIPQSSALCWESTRRWSASCWPRSTIPYGRARFWRLPISELRCPPSHCSSSGRRHRGLW
jgi:hypothetical protein